MKKFMLAVCTVAVAALFAVSAYAAPSNATANSTAAAEIVTPLTISNVNGLDFGKVAASSSATGTVVIATGSARTKTGDVILIEAGSTPKAAKFNVGGAGNATYTVTLPTSIVISKDSTNNMTVNNFTSNPSGTGTLDAAGAQELLVGATLNVAVGQAAGTYTGNFDVTVQYN